MSELQTFTVDSEALSLLASVTSRELATDPEKLPSAESSALASRAVSNKNNRPHAIYLDSAHVPRAHVRAPRMGAILHMGAFFIRITGALRWGRQGAFRVRPPLGRDRRPDDSCRV
eukprot:scaffold27539_cov28-Attheya_sp.AAC.1